MSLPSHVASGVLGFGLAAVLFALWPATETKAPERPARGERDPGARPEPYELRAMDGAIERRRERGLEGRWKRAREMPGGPGAADDRSEELERLEAIGYASGVERAAGAAGVTAHDPARAQPGLNLYVSGHAREAILMDMEGEVLHTWRCAPIPTGDPRHEQDFLATAHLLADGELLVLLGTTGLVKLDKDSNVLWELANGSHHDLFVAQDGRIYVLTREARFDPAIHPTEAVLLDDIVVLDPDGNELDRTSIYRAFADSPFAPSLDHAPPHGDLLHTNTIEVSDGALAGRAPAFARGNVLVSMKFMSTIAMVDLDSKQVVWTMTGMWKWQHRPTLLANGNVLILDNQGGREELGRSRAIEFDPLTQEIAFLYEGRPGNELSTLHSGTVARLPNANTLIVESEGGRALEVTPEGEIVWEFVNPHRSGPRGELIATLFDLVRLPMDLPLDWLRGGSGQ